LRVPHRPAARSEPDDLLHLPTLAEAEVRLARLAVDRAGGNKLKASNALVISRHKLYDLLRRSAN
jgi:DNA-binding NtrC family response regulator